eukprot:gene9311-1578_t
MHRDFVMKTVSIALLLLIAVNGVVSAENLARGWGDSVAWRTLDAGSVEAAETGKPLMLLIHKSWCGACKSLKPKLASSDEFAELSKYFVMVNLQDDEEPDDAAYAPDGRYIPRILFAGSKSMFDLHHMAARNCPKIPMEQLLNLFSTKPEAPSINTTIQMPAWL